MLDMLEHGGSDLGPPVTWDFSTNANPLPQPEALSLALARADRRPYPEPSYLRLRERLAAFGLGEVDRILPTAGSAEAIRRLTLMAHLQGARHVWVPWPGFGEYAAAAGALGLLVHRFGGVQALADGLKKLRKAGDTAPSLVWVCDPCNPTGRCLGARDWLALTEVCQAQGATLAVDLAYAPMRGPTPCDDEDEGEHAGETSVPECVRDIAWQLWSPNKALGLTGVRAGAMVAPRSIALTEVARVAHLAPSWVLSAEGVAVLQAWCEPAVQAWLKASAGQCQAWRVDLVADLQALGWQLFDTASEVPFILARPPEGEDAAQVLQRCRAAGIRLRDATSLGLPGWLRLRAHVPEARRALLQCLRHGQKVGAA